jgi:hypothetical protein
MILKSQDKRDTPENWWIWPLINIVRIGSTGDWFPDTQKDHLPAKNGDGYIYKKL